MRRTLCAVLAFSSCAIASGACASDEEIQVYMDEMNPKGGFGLDLHLNYVPKGRGADVDYLGQQASQGRFRITPEFSYGLTPNIELGAYLPLATLDDHGHGEIGGVKGRIKFIAPRGGDGPVFWGLNFEIGRVRRDLDINPWNAELKGIVGWRKGPWTAAANLNIDWTVSGRDPQPTSFQLATKFAYQVHDSLAVGIENYNGLGDAKRFGRLGENDQTVFLTADKRLGGWDLDLGVGYGYGQPEDRWVVRAIVGVPI